MWKYDYFHTGTMLYFAKRNDKEMEDDIMDQALVEALLPSNPGKGSCTDQEYPGMFNC